MAKMHDMNQRLSGLDDIQSLIDRVARLEEEMKDKLDKIDFANEVARLREMIGNTVGDDKKTKISTGGASSGSHS